MRPQPFDRKSTPATQNKFYVMSLPHDSGLTFHMHSRKDNFHTPDVQKAASQLRVSRNHGIHVGPALRVERLKILRQRFEWRQHVISS